MKCIRLALEKLRNEEWFQYVTEFRTLSLQYGVETLQIEELFAQFNKQYTHADTALELIRKSAITQELKEADKTRNSIFRGFVDAVKSAINHYNTNKKAAAQRIKIVLDHFGNINRTTYDEQTATIYNLVQLMRGNSAADIELLQLTEWMTELEKQNTNFDTLMKKRYAEQANKTDLRMKIVRAEADLYFRKILDRINALILINGTHTYELYVRDLNARTERYINSLAQRKGCVIT